MLVVSAREAFDAGLTRYFSGKPCKHGHIAERMISNGSCAECLKVRRVAKGGKAYDAVKAWRAANPQAWAEQSERYRKKYPEKMATRSKRCRDKHIDERRPREAAYARAMRARNPEAQRKRIERFKLKREAKLTEIAGRPRQEACEICKEAGKTVFDHCHVSDKFRGWLCDRCNRTLGQVKDNTDILFAMIEYLEKHREQDNGQTAKRFACEGIRGAV